MSGVTKRQHAVYKAEIKSGVAWSGAYILPAHAQAALDKLAQSAWWKRRTKVRRLELRWKPGNVFCYGHQCGDDETLGIVIVNASALSPGVLFHEAAHVLTYDEVEDHGPRWMRAYVAIVTRQFGPWAGELLQEAFEQDGLW